MKRYLSLLILLVIPLAHAIAVSQDRIAGPGVTVIPTPTPAPAPYDSFRGVRIGMPADQARTKLGTPKEKTSSGEFFVISLTETAQLIYERDQTVKSITANFTGDLRLAPSPKDVFGTDIKKDPDGSISKMVSFPKEGFWISYVRTPGKDAMVVITIQKLLPS